MADETKNDEQQPNLGGRPSCYTDKYAEQAYKLTLLGATNKELADFFDVCEDTIYEWKKVFPEFSESIKQGKIQADAEIASKLYHRAKGYEHSETKVFCSADKDGKGVITTFEVTKHYPPEVGAIAFWLKNRQPKIWRDSHDFTSGGEKIVPQCVSFLLAMKPPAEPETPTGLTGGEISKAGNIPA